MKRDEFTPEKGCNEFNTSSRCVRFDDSRRDSWYRTIEISILEAMKRNALNSTIRKRFNILRKRWS